MNKLAELLGLKCHIDNSIGIKWLSKLLKRYQVTGYLRGKNISIYVQRTRGNFNVSVRTIVHIPFESNLSNSLIIYPKRTQIISHIFGKQFHITRDKILDKYVMIKCEDDDLREDVFKYEEILDQCSNVWNGKCSCGTLIINNTGITYFEPNGFMNDKKRERLVQASNLLCDLADVLMMRNTKNTC